MKLQKTIFTLSLIIFSSFLFGGCLFKKKTAENTAVPTPTPRLVELDPQDRPYISLTPRADGHELKLQVINIPQKIGEIEYELIYTAKDESIEIEKGVGDTVKIEGSKLEKDLLLGTESCTSGCKYKYDEGVTGGSLSLVFVSTDGQVSTYQTDFTLNSSEDINQNKQLSLADFTLNATATKGQYWILLKNFGAPNRQPVTNIYSVFSSGNGAGTVDSIPDGFTKENLKSLSGDYIQN